jgi:hypothetical protein
MMRRQVLLDVGDFAVTDVQHVDHVLVEGSAVVAARVVQFDGDGVPAEPVSA